MDDSDSEYEEEESLVLLELAGTLDTAFLSRVKQCKLLGIDTEHPLLQLDNYIYSGEYQDTMGTCLLLEDQSEQGNGKSTEREPEKKQLEFKYLTNKKLCMKMSFLRPNNTEEQSSETSGNHDDTASSPQPSTSSMETIETKVTTGDQSKNLVTAEVQKGETVTEPEQAGEESTKKRKTEQSNG